MSTNSSFPTHSSFGAILSVKNHLYKFSFNLINRLSSGISHLPSNKSVLAPDLSDSITFLILLPRTEKALSKSTQVEVSIFDTARVVSQVTFLIVARVASLYSGMNNRNVLGSTLITARFKLLFFDLIFCKYSENQVVSLSALCGG